MYNPLLPAGQTVMSNSNPVTIASDQSAIAVKPGSSWGVGINGTATIVAGQSLNVGIIGTPSVTLGQSTNVGLLGGTQLIGIVGVTNVARTVTPGSSWFVGFYGSSQLLGMVGVTNAVTVNPGSSWTVALNTNPTIANTGFGASITNFPTVQIVGITNSPAVTVTNIVGVTVTNASAIGGGAGASQVVPGSSWNVGIIGLIGVTVTNAGAISAGGASQVIPLQSSGLSLHVNLDNGVSVTNFPTNFTVTPGSSWNHGIIGNVTTIPGSSWFVGLIGGISINNQGFGVSVTNFPATQVVAYGASITVAVTNFPASQTVALGASLTVALNVNPTITNTGFNINGGSIANSSFGASITNFPTVQVVGITNVPTVNLALSGTAIKDDTGFGDNVTTGIESVAIRLYNSNASPGYDRLNGSAAGGLLAEVRQDSSAVMAGTSVRTPVMAGISVAASGDNTVITGLSGLAIRVLQYSLTVGSSVTMIWKSGASGSLLSGGMPFGSPGGIAQAYSPVGVLQTGTSLPLILNLSASSTIGGYLTYITV